MIRLLSIALVLLSQLAALNALEISKSLVRIEATSQEPNYKTPGAQERYPRVSAPDSSSRVATS
jgi:hypothetical protein